MNETKSLEPHPFILPGKYKALWSGYTMVIIFHNGNESHNIKMNNGVRGINCKCNVIVDDKGWIFED